MPVRYKAVAEGVIRKAVDKSSTKVGKLEIGEIIEVLSTEDAGGTVRVEFDRGWTSVTAGNGKALLELVTDGDDTAESESSKPEEQAEEAEPAYEAEDGPEDTESLLALPWGKARGTLINSGRWCAAEADFAPEKLVGLHVCVMERGQG